MEANVKIVAWFYTPMLEHDVCVLGARKGVSDSQQTWEALVLLISLRCWAPYWRQVRCRLQIRSDNVAALAVVAKMKAEVLQARYDEKGTPLGVRIVGDLPGLAHWLTGPWAPVVNKVNNLGFVRGQLEKIAGIDHRRPLPAFSAPTPPA